MKQRIIYNYGHPGSVNPTVITNRDAYIFYGHEQKLGLYKLKAFARKQGISSYFRRLKLKISGGRMPGTPDRNSCLTLRDGPFEKWGEGGGEAKAKKKIFPSNY